MDKEVLSGSRILIVDDQEPNVLLLERVLQHAGYKNYLAITDSRQILDQFRTFQPDLILLDLMMPKLDGYAVMRQLNGWIPSGAYLPILVITADASRIAKQKALGLGAKDFLAKPIDTAEATLRVHNLLVTRWLYRQMEHRTELCAELASASKRRLDAALRELDRFAEKGQALAEDLRWLRIQLLHAAEAIERLASEAAGDFAPASSFPSSVPAGLEQAT